MSFSRRQAPALVGAVVSAALGLAFVVVAARSYPRQIVGVAAAATIALVWLAVVAELGLSHELARVLPKAGSDRPRLTAAPAVLVGVVALVSCGLFVAGLGAWAPGLGGLRDTAVTVVAVVAAGVVLALAALGDGVLAGLGLGRWLPALRTTVGVVRLGLLALLAGRSGWLGDFGPLLAWSAPLLLVVIGIGIFAWRWFLTDPGDDIDTEHAAARLRSADRSLRVMVRHARAGWGLDLAGPTTVAVVTLIVLGRLGAAEVASWLAAAVVAGGLYHLAGALAQALSTAPLAEQADRDRQMLHHALFGAIMAAPLVLIAFVAAPTLMGLFGADYRSDATGLVRVLVLAVPAVGVVRLYSARVRRQRRLDVAVAFEGAIALITMILAWTLITTSGLIGLGIAWLMATMAAAGYVVFVESVWWWGPRLSSRGAQLAAVGPDLAHRWRQLRTLRAMNDQVGSHLEALYPTHPSWERVSWDLDRQSIAVAGHDGRPPLRLELARTSLGSDLLAKRVAAVREVNELTGLQSLRGLVPYPIDHSRENPVTYLVESTISGHAGHDTALEVPVSARVEAIIPAVTELHRATADCVTLDADGLDHWIARPLRTLGDGCLVHDDHLMGPGADPASRVRRAVAGLGPPPRAPPPRRHPLRRQRQADRDPGVGLEPPRPRGPRLGVADPERPGGRLWR